jgi:uncharacterized integral membrane protein
MTATQNRSDPPSQDAKTTMPSRRPREMTRSRLGELWVALVVGAFVLLVLLVFIMQNGQQARVSFLGAHGNLPMGVALLLAAVFGVLLVALPGTARIVQLRTRSRRARVATPAADPSISGGPADATVSH